MWHKQSISTRRTERVRFSCVYAYTYVVRVLTCFSVDYAYRIYSNKRRGAYYIFRASTAALIRGRRLIKNWKLQGNLLFQFNGKSSFCTKKLQLVIKASFHCHHSPLWHFSVMSSLISDLTPPSTTTLFERKDISSVVFRLSLQQFSKLYGIPRISATSKPRRLFEGGAY